MQKLYEQLKYAIFNAGVDDMEGFLGWDITFDTDDALLDAIEDKINLLTIEDIMDYCVRYCPNELKKVEFKIPANIEIGSKKEFHLLMRVLEEAGEFQWHSLDKPTEYTPYNDVKSVKSIQIDKYKRISHADISAREMETEYPKCAEPITLSEFFSLGKYKEKDSMEKRVTKPAEPLCDNLSLMNEAITTLDKALQKEEKAIDTPYGKADLKYGYLIREIRIIENQVYIDIYAKERSLKTGDCIRGGDEAYFKVAGDKVYVCGQDGNYHPFGKEQEQTTPSNEIEEEREME